MLDIALCAVFACTFRLENINVVYKLPEQRRSQAFHTDISNHTYGEWVIITEATCKSTGLKRRTCTDSSFGKTVIVNLSSQNNPGMWGMDLAVNYDKTKLIPVSVTNGMVFADTEWTKGNLS